MEHVSYNATPVQEGQPSTRECQIHSFEAADCIRDSCQICSFEATNCIRDSYQTVNVVGGLL